jgi:anti-sigma regulatory factor (Ser/Thr protein kinase)
MLRYHMAVITRDNALKRAIKRLTTATGSTADFIGDATGLNPEHPISLAIYDAREAPPDKLFFAKVPKEAKIIYIIDSEGLIPKVGLFKDERVVSLFSYDSMFDDDEFVATATKALRGEIFGLQKYFPWGVTSFSMVVKNHEEKGKAIEILMQYANLAGVRGGVRDRIQLVCDELMMNALYHAPTDKEGKELYAGKTLKELAQLDMVNPIEVRYACSGRYFGVSVRDGGGSLSRDRALEYMRKAQASAAIETKTSGAGLGLVSVLKSVSKLVFNLEFGVSTEVVALFDMELFAKGKVGARSLHLFAAPEAPPDADSTIEDEEAAAAAATEGAANDEANYRIRSRGPVGAWVLAAILGATVAAMGTAFYMKQATPAAAAASGSPRLTVSPTPSDATILLDGKEPISANTPFTLHGNQTVEVSKEGFQPKSIPLANVQSDLILVVELVPAPKPR